MRGRWAGLGAVVLVLGLSSCAEERSPVPQGRPPVAVEESNPGPGRAVAPPAPPQEHERSAGPRHSDGRPAPARISIPRLGITGLKVVAYRGRTDDARGTAIQNAGTAASPHGPHGGVGPGGIGNFQVTGHRLSSTQPFRYLPRLARGDRVLVDARGRRFIYRIVATRSTSFRSARSLREQRAAVPGRPGVEPRRAMITLSTCATIEDHAAGNFWADEFDNPEHRIDKIGVLARVVPVGSR